MTRWDPHRADGILEAPEFERGFLVSASLDEARDEAPSMAWRTVKQLKTAYDPAPSAVLASKAFDFTRNLDAPLTWILAGTADRPREWRHINCTGTSKEFIELTKRQSDRAVLPSLELLSVNTETTQR